VRLDELRRRYGLREDADTEAVERAAEKLVPETVDPAEKADVRQRVASRHRPPTEAQRVVVHLHRFEG